MIHSNQIKNCPITVEDVATASKIWGENVDALKGKTTRRKPEVVKKGPCQGAQGAYETPQGYIFDGRHFFREQDTVLSHFIEENYVYCSPPSCKPNGPADI